MKLSTVLATILLSVSALASDVLSKPVQHEQMDFGLVPYYGQRTRVLTLTNNGERPLTDISVKSSGDFDSKHNCPSTLKKAESCQVKITFWAVREGVSYGRLLVRTSAMDYDYELSGYGGRDPSAHLPPPPPPIPYP